MMWPRLLAPLAALAFVAAGETDAQTLTSGERNCTWDGTLPPRHTQTGAAAPLIETALHDPSKVTRDLAIRSLGKIGAMEAVIPLARLSADSDQQIRQAAVWSLGQIQSPSAIDAVVVSSRDSSKHVRSEAAWALGLIGTAHALPNLLVLARDQNEHVRLAAACSLGRLPAQSSAKKALDVLRRDTSEFVRSAADWALKQNAR